MVVYSENRERPMGRGRPRSAVADENILSSALELLVERGYGGATIGAVAMHAHAGSQTIYRRYANRDEMLAAAIDWGVHVREVENTGDTRADLRMMLSAMAESMPRETTMGLLGTVLAEEHRHPVLLATYRRRVVWPRRRLIRAVLERGQKRGEIRQDAGLETVTDLLWGSMYARYMVGVEDEEGLFDQVMELVWAGIAEIPDESEV
jgi:AcrR family transcriptional regulator